MKKIINLVLLVIAMACFESQAAWDGSVTGAIDRIEVTNGGNYGFRVLLKDKPELCGNEHTWAYINENDSNYETYVSVLLSAKVSGTKVQLLTRKETISGNEYCHIGYIRML